jgi:hypothetical protein
MMMTAEAQIKAQRSGHDSGREQQVFARSRRHPSPAT